MDMENSLLFIDPAAAHLTTLTRWCTGSARKIAKVFPLTLGCHNPRALMIVRMWRLSAWREARVHHWLSTTAVNKQVVAVYRLSSSDV